MGPILLSPHYISPIWGGTAIARARGIDLARGQNYGEAFDVSAHEGVESVVANGLDAGTPLGQLLSQRHREVMGDDPEDMVVQVVSMDARQNLSVQVHPDEAYARRVEHDREKAESWYILDAAPGATLIAGCTTDDVDQLRRAAASDTIGQEYGRQVPVQQGDFVLIPAGTLHALGAGIFAVEVGSFGNTTYRLCDWGRGRPLQVDRGFDVLRTGNEPVVRHLGQRDPSRPQVRVGADHRLFHCDVVDVSGSWECELGGTYRVVTCVEGAAGVNCGGQEVRLGYTTSCIVPACAQGFQVSGDCRVLVSSHPLSAA